MWVVLTLVILFLLGWAVAATFYLWKFARIILILENDFSETTETLQDAEQTLTECLELPMFFDSPDVQRAASNALNGIRASKVAVAGLVRKFTQRSKQKYIEVVETTKDSS